MVNPFVVLADTPGRVAAPAHLYALAKFPHPLISTAGFGTGGGSGGSGGVGGGLGGGGGSGYMLSVMLSTPRPSWLTPPPGGTTFQKLYGIACVGFAAPGVTTEPFTPFCALTAYSVVPSHSRSPMPHWLPLKLPPAPAAGMKYR